MECRKEQMKMTEEINKIEKEIDFKVKELEDIKEIFIRGTIVSRQLLNMNEINKVDKIKKEIFGDIIYEEDMIDPYKNVIQGISVNFLKKHNFNKNIKNEQLLNKLTRLEMQIKKNNEIIESDDFQTKKYISTMSYEDNLKKEYKEKKEKILNKNRREKEKLQYLINIYESEIILLKAEQEKHKILKKNIEELTKLRDSKDAKITKMVNLYNNTVDKCKSKCNIKNEEYIKKMGVIIGTDYLTKEKLDKEFVKDVLKNKKCCDPDLGNRNSLYKNKCELIGGMKCDLKYLLEKKKMAENLLKTYNHEYNTYKVPELKLQEDINNQLVKDKIEILRKFSKKQTDEINKYKYVEIDDAKTSVIDCEDDFLSKDERELCNLKVNEMKKLTSLRNKYREYYNKYGCINKSLIENNDINDNYITDCKSDFKKKINEEKNKLIKIISELQKQNDYINSILEKIDKQIFIYENKSQNFNCNKELAKFSKSMLKEMENLYLKCLC